LSALQDYGDNIAKYLLANDQHSRPDSLSINREAALHWEEELKPKLAAAAADFGGYKEETAGLMSTLEQLSRQEGSSPQFYEVLAKINYASPEATRALKYFQGLADGFLAGVAA
jgi:hypothetical protein